MRPASDGYPTPRRWPVPGRPTASGPSPAATCPRWTRPPPARTHVAAPLGQARCAVRDRLPASAPAPALLAPAPAARSGRPGRSRSQARRPVGQAVGRPHGPAPASAAHPRHAGRDQSPAGRLREPKERAARPGTRLRGNQVPHRAATAGWRCPGRHASRPGVPARASARTWGRLADRTCHPAGDLSPGESRFRAQTPIRSGRRALGRSLDRPAEPGGCR